MFFPYDFFASPFIRALIRTSPVRGHRKTLFFDILRQTPYKSFIHSVRRTLQKNGAMKFSPGGLKAEMRHYENKV